MINSFYLFFIVLGSLVSGVSIENYCTMWYPDTTNDCIKDIRDNSYFKDNSEFVIKRRQNGDFSVGNSYNMYMKKDEYKTHMLIDPAADLLMPPVNMNTMDKYVCNVFPVTENVHRSFPRLEEPLDSSLKVYKSYILSGLLDTMYTSFKASLPDFDVDLSLKMLQDFVGENATVNEALRFLRKEGVCSKEDYAKEKARGTEDSPFCYRFKLRSFERLNYTNACQFAFAVRKAPVFALAALKPQALQMYAFQSSQHPMNTPYIRYTIAGVVTGYSRDDEHPFWEMLVRRQGANNNRLRVKMDMKYPFAGLIYHSYSVDADTEDYRTNRPMREVREVCSIKELNDIPVDVTTIRVLSGCLNDDTMSLQINNFPELRVFEVDSGSMKRVSILTLNNLPNLKYVFIGDESFTEYNGQNTPHKPSLRRVVTLENNPRLEAFFVGAYSFAEYEDLVLTNLPALRFLQIGVKSTNIRKTFNFFYMNTLAIENLPSLESISIGDSAFVMARDISFSNLPKLVSLTLGYAVASGVQNMCNQNNKLTLKNLDLLSTISVSSKSLNQIRKVIVQDVPSTTSVFLDQGSLGCVKDLYVEGRVKSNSHIVSTFCSFRSSILFYLNSQSVGTCSSMII